MFVFDLLTLPPKIAMSGFDVMSVLASFYFYLLLTTNLCDPTT